jgi:polysaccharide biosynthesis/export protein
LVLAMRLISSGACKWACLIVGVFLCYGAPGSAATAKSSKELFDYIQEARKLGLPDEVIQKHALSAGWDQPTIEQTYATIRQLGNEKLPAGSPPRMAEGSAPGYRIGAGDVLQIVVWKEPEASVPEAVVRADGRISVPLIREVEAAGLTIMELQKVLEERLGKYIVDPTITVVARQINSKKVYIVGAVKKEGPIALVRPLTVLQALNEAGGLTDYAKKKKIYVLRILTGGQTRLPFDYQAVIRGEHLEQNRILLPDDTIVVPQ